MPVVDFPHRDIADRGTPGFSGRVVFPSGGGLLGQVLRDGRVVWSVLFPAGTRESDVAGEVRAIMRSRYNLVSGTDRGWHRLACGQCGARPGDPCRTASGSIAKESHRQRWFGTQ